MRALARQILIADATLTGLGVVPSGVRAGHMDTPAMRPFLDLVWGETTPGLDTEARRALMVWVHDKPADYARIDAIIRRIKELYADVVAAQHSFGYIQQIQWITDSSDLTDDAHGTVVRTTSFILVGSGN